MLSELEPRPTKSAQVYRELRRDITSGRYAPGQNLVRRDMLKKYAVSLSIINEVLARLVNDGLIEQGERESARVIEPSDAQIRSDFMLREAVERQVVRLLAETADDEILRSLRADAQSLDRWIATEGPDSTLHLEFHLKMARATGYPSLEDTLRRLGTRSLLVARWLQSQRLYHPADFHERLIEAIQSRNALTADEAMRAHLHYGENLSPKVPGSAA